MDSPLGWPGHQRRWQSTEGGALVQAGAPTLTFSGNARAWRLFVGALAINPGSREAQRDDGVGLDIAFAGREICARQGRRIAGRRRWEAASPFARRTLRQLRLNRCPFSVEGPLARGRRSSSCRFDQKGGDRPIIAEDPCREHSSLGGPPPSLAATCAGWARARSGGELT